MSPTEKWQDKIAALLRKAEDPSIGQAEADSFFEKAQELMTKYAIDEAIIASRRTVTEAEQIVRAEIHFHSIYSRALYYVGRAIAVNNDCKVLIRKGNSLMHTTLVVIGYESDVRRVEMLNASVQIQCAAATVHFWNDYEDKWMLETERERFKVRRQFIFSYSNGLDDKLAHARERGLATAGQEYGDTSVALVVRDKSQHVEAWVEESYGKLRKSGGKSFAGGGHEAHVAGYTAGQNANVSSDPQVRSNVRSLKDDRIVRRGG